MDEGVQFESVTLVQIASVCFVLDDVILENNQCSIPTSLMSFVATTCCVVPPFFAMDSGEYKVVKKVWLGNDPKIRSFKKAALLKPCWFARGQRQFLIWRRADFVDPHTGLLLFGQEIDIDPDSNSK